MAKPYVPIRFLYHEDTTTFFPYGDTIADDLLEHINFEDDREPRILSLGCGDIGSCFFTLWKHFDPTGSARHFFGARFVRNDISAAVLARNILFLYMAMKIPSWKQREAAKQWISSMWAIWYCHELLPIHEEALMEALDALMSFSETMESWSGVVENPLRNVVKLTDQETLSKIRDVWRMWRYVKFGSVENALSEMGKKVPAHYASRSDSIPLFMTHAMRWLKETNQFSLETMSDAMTADYTRYMREGSCFAEDCYDITYTRTPATLNPTIYEQESGQYTMESSILPFETFHHGILVSQTNLRRLEMSLDVAGQPLAVDEDSFFKNPMLSNCVQQFSIWVSSTGAILKERSAKSKPDITITFNCSDCLQFCEQHQINPFKGIPSHFDAIYTSNLADFLSPPIVLYTASPLLKRTGCLSMMTQLYRRAASSGEEYLRELFGLSLEMLPLISGTRCIGHDGKYTEPTSVMGTPASSMESVVLDFKKTRYDKIFVWQKVDSSPMKFELMGKRMSISRTLHAAVHNSIMSFYKKREGSECNVALCTETAISTVLSLVSQLDADIDISNYTFWDEFCSLLQNTTALRPFLYHIQTQALLHGLHFHVTVSETDCPICLKTPLDEYISRFSIELDALPVNPLHKTLPIRACAILVHKHSYAPPEIELDLLNMNEHIVDSAQGRETPDGKIKLDFFFPTQFFDEDYFYTITMQIVSKASYQYVTSAMPKKCQPLACIRVSFNRDPFVFRQAGANRSKLTSTSLGSVLSHIGDANHMETTLSVAPKVLSLLSSKTISISLEYVSLSSIQVACGKYNLTVTYPYPVDKSNVKTIFMPSKGTIRVVAPRERYHIYNERGLYFSNPSHLMSMPSMHPATGTVEAYGCMQLTKEDAKSLSDNARSTICNLKLLMLALFRYGHNDIIKVIPAADLSSMIRRPLAYILVQRQAADVARYTPVLDLYYIIHDPVSFDRIHIKWSNMMWEMAQDGTHPYELPVDDDWSIFKKVLEFFASRTRPVSKSYQSYVTKHGLEKQLTHAVVYPMFCDQDGVAHVFNGEIPKIPAYSYKCPDTILGATTTITVPSGYSLSIASSFSPGSSSSPGLSATFSISTTTTSASSTTATNTYSISNTSATSNTTNSSPIATITTTTTLSTAMANSLGILNSLPSAERGSTGVKALPAPNSNCSPNPTSQLPTAADIEDVTDTLSATTASSSATTSRTDTNSISATGDKSTPLSPTDKSLSSVNASYEPTSTSPTVEDTTVSSTSKINGSRESKKANIKCSYCGESLLKMKKCARCGGTWYCGRECQVKHWREHKAVCKPPAPELRCSNCGNKNSFITQCGDCKAACYCSEGCWSKHKLSCPAHTVVQ